MNKFLSIVAASVLASCSAEPAIADHRGGFCNPPTYVVHEYVPVYVPPRPRGNMYQVHPQYYNNFQAPHSIRVQPSVGVGITYSVPGLSIGLGYAR